MSLDWRPHLHAVSLFEEVRDVPGCLDAIAAIIEHRDFKPGSPIIKEGELGSEVFILIKGEANVFKSTSEGEPYKVAILKGTHHAFFGEGGLLDSDARSATIQADSHCGCLVLSRAAFETFSDQHPEWALPILSRIARAVLARSRKTNNDLLLLYNALVAEIRGR